MWAVRRPRVSGMLEKLPDRSDFPVEVLKVILSKQGVPHAKDVQTPRLCSVIDEAVERQMYTISRYVSQSDLEYSKPPSSLEW